jgi:mRNA degradation ribonuclease J1/J2
LKARIEYVTLKPRQATQVGSATVTPYLLNHPVINFGYRIECDGKSIFFTGDYEPPYNIYEPADDEYAEYQGFLDEKLLDIQSAIDGVDVLIADCSYTQAEYPAKKGWGHGTYNTSIQIAAAAKARVLFCTHHEPTRSDDALEAAFAQALAQSSPLPADLDIRLAKEGESYEF